MHILHHLAWKLSWHWDICHLSVNPLIFQRPLHNLQSHAGGLRSFSNDRMRILHPRFLLYVSPCASLFLNVMLSYLKYNCSQNQDKVLPMVGIQKYSQMYHILGLRKLIRFKFIFWYLCTHKQKWCPYKIMYSHLSLDFHQDYLTSKDNPFGTHKTVFKDV